MRVLELSTSTGNDRRSSSRTAGTAPGRVASAVPLAVSAVQALAAVPESVFEGSQPVSRWWRPS